MISKILKIGAIVTALLSICIGMCLYTTIPRRIGFYHFLTKVQPVFIGLTPVFMDGIEWKYTWDEYYSPETVQMLKGQSAIVTGGNSGIGFDLAVALIKNGVDVTITCRSESKCDVAKKDIVGRGGANKGNLSTMLLDTASFASVRSFCETYVNTFPNTSIDMLFFNAGTNFLGLKDPEENPKCTPKTKDDNIEYLFQVNYLSHHLMYQLLEPYLSSGARIIQTSSASAFSTFSYKVATDLETLNGCSEHYLKPISGDNLSYGQSKLAQDMWCKVLTRRLDNKNPRNIAANSFHPGLVNTAILGKVFDAYDGPKWMEDWMLNTVMPNYAWQSPDGALTGLYLATHPNIKGKYYHPQAQEVVNPLALDEELQDKLWNFSQELIKEYVTPPIQVHTATNDSTTAQQLEEEEVTNEEETIEEE